MELQKQFNLFPIYCDCSGENWLVISDENKKQTFCYNIPEKIVVNQNQILVG